MFAYEIIEETGRGPVVLANFSAPWSASVPIFNAAAHAYFAGQEAGSGRVLFLYATLEQGDAPYQTALVCSAHQVGHDAERRVEIRAGPLLDAALRALRH